jgi:protein involved in polysaccharide export with SLBB domain
MKCLLLKGGAAILLAAVVLWTPHPGQCAPGATTDKVYSYDPLQTPAVSEPATTSAAIVLPPTSTGYVPDDKHLLREGDQVSFQIIEDRDPAINLIVTDSGELDIPYVGRVACEGKTCKQLAQELKGLLEKEYYYRATVVIGLNAASKTRGRVYIWGEVRKQGPVDIPADENFTVGKAIMQAGGFADFANKRKVKLVRTADDGTKETTEVDLVNILEKGKTDQDLTVREDDFIIVPSRLINF